MRGIFSPACSVCRLKSCVGDRISTTTGGPNLAAGLRRSGAVYAHRRQTWWQAFRPDNFWSMGDTGPAARVRDLLRSWSRGVGRAAGSPEEDGDRYIEIWNLVFMQYNRDASGEMTLLPKPSVDTGMGLERLAAVMQGCPFELRDRSFQGLIRAAAGPPAPGSGCQVAAGHRRPYPFLRFFSADGVTPGNEGRGICAAANHPDARFGMVISWARSSRPTSWSMRWISRWRGVSGTSSKSKDPVARVIKPGRGALCRDD